jgi:hypothetical protein
MFKIKAGSWDERYAIRGLLKIIQKNGFGRLVHIKYRIFSEAFREENHTQFIPSYVEK